ncbi:MAG: flagellar filament outer layer protein FlaA [Treponema porcinum]|uniref:flagellar filament outer layer protein FlaA n=2 Tax=Treponema porcinum TaxID=261392 RepID=UPI002356194C|nr:flagellar filament outer layer protein FlaA [Treponema porcinum]MCI6180472.1 flagellar filament outer layer protein FlaA [Treponema porcinum]MCI6323133.1 flagellar filament outer layer protein FlaA [Treponema porcinum]MCI6814986.1 flagellar filament outer layer protein FlaA [Treponema porcinum]MCI6983031.1 flagellar filament outer layer protein FlaA [Treponema porcinum]MCI7080468.1 flagellar filament outer layer protein FlaA [Treponema porcinum]
MKKVLFAVIAASVFTFAVSAQNSLVEDPNPETIGNESAMQALHEISLDKFEREGSWGVHISPDYGVITGRLFEGSPAMKDPLKEDEGKENEDTQVLGVKVEFFKRGINSFYITSQRPIPIEGVTKTVSVWVCGRNMGHELYLLVEDYFGRNYELYMGSLGFSGWKKLTAVVPPSPDGEHGIVQHSAYYGDKPGLRIIGFRVDCDPMLSRGAYYMYLDDLRCVTDLYDMQNHDEDDMADNW